MANAASGEPLGFRNAVVLYGVQSAYGTAAAPATSAGLARAGWTRCSSNAYFQGPGSAGFQARKGGSTFVDWTLQLPAVQTGAKSLLQKAARSGGVLPLLTLGLGYQDDQSPANRDADQIQDCKVNLLRLGLDASSGHGPLVASLSGIGGLVTDLTTLAPAALASKPWTTFEATFTKASVAYEVRTFRMQVMHHLSRDHVIPGAAPASFPRGHRYLTEHAEAIYGDVSRYAKSGAGVQNGTVSEFDLALTLTSLDDGTMLTLTLSNCDFGEERVDADEAGIFYRTPFRAKSWSIS